VFVITVFKVRPVATASAGPAQYRPCGWWAIFRGCCRRCPHWLISLI